MGDGSPGRDALDEKPNERAVSATQHCIWAVIEFAETVLSLDALMLASRNFVSGRPVEQFKQFLAALAEVDEARELVDSFRREFRLVRVRTQDESKADNRSGDVAADIPESAVTDLAEILRAAQPMPARAMLAHSRLEASRPPGQLIAAGALQAAVATFEGLVRSQVALVHQVQPDRVSGRSLSVEEFVQLGSVSDVVAEAIEQQVDTIMAGGLTDWDKWWAKPSQLGCTLQSLSFDSTQLVELLQRRHVVTHTAGRASGRYIRLTGSGVQKGELLPVTPAYVRAALENLSAVGLRLVMLAAKKFLPADRMQAVASAVVLVATQDLPSAGLWAAIPPIAASVANSEIPPDWSDEMRIVAHWARLERGDASSTAELQAWNPTSLSVRNACLRSMVLQDPTAEDLLEAAVEAGEVNPVERSSLPLITWWASRPAAPTAATE